MSGILAEIGPAWTWVIAGLVLGVGELMAPGVFLIWLGLAAVATGAVVAAVDLFWPWQLLVFAALAVATVFIGRQVTRHPPHTLNRRGHDLVGQTVVLDQPIVGGSGRLTRGDTSWRIIGPDLSSGTSVLIQAMDGTTLVVAPTSQTESLTPPASPKS